ncbi:MAG: hypothetical protein HQK53_09915 [Oligoflexia bacterium]|nr:hypothetical protein [Oligoflexia bacterium]
MENVKKHNALKALKALKEMEITPCSGSGSGKHIFLLRLTDTNNDDQLGYQPLTQITQELIQEFANKGVRIILIDLDIFLDSVSREQYYPYVMVTATSLREKEVFEKLVQTPLLSAVKNKKTYLFHISSFEKSSCFPLLGALSRHYYFYSAPLDIRWLVNEISNHYLSLYSSDERWPGGKRGRLVDIFDHSS